MKFDPKDAVNLIPDGEYDAEILDAEETRSKAGNDMMKLTVKVFPGGGDRVVFDYAVVPKTLYKLKQLAAAVGEGAKFAAGELGPSDLRGKGCRVTIETEEGRNGFDDKNTIRRYLPQVAGASPPSRQTQSTPPGDDEIPF